jgi:glycogen synthase
MKCNAFRFVRMWFAVQAIFRYITMLCYDSATKCKGTMSRPLNILFVSSEVDPFAKTGGLADVSSALPKAIKDLGHEIRIMLPRYRFIGERKFRLHDIIRLKEIPIPVGINTAIGNVKSSFITNQKDKVQVYFLDNEEYFGRDGIYQIPATKKDYKDNDERFIFFCRGVLETLKRLGWQPDVIHCNDWQTGLIPAYLKTIYKDDPFFRNVKSVFTIHNMAYQGSFPILSQKPAFRRTSFAPTALKHTGISIFSRPACSMPIPSRPSVKNTLRRYAPLRTWVPDFKAS